MAPVKLRIPVPFRFAASCTNGLPVSVFRLPAVDLKAVAAKWLATAGKAS